MKITFEGEDMLELYVEIAKFIQDMPAAVAPPPLVKPTPAVPKAAKPPKGKPGRKPGYKPAPKPVQKAVQEPVDEPVENPVEELVEEPAASPFEPETLDMARLATIRIKTTEDLQAAYSSGKHKQVLELLAKFGNGAKSFRELSIKDFLPIREAIDAGALS